LTSKTEEKATQKKFARLSKSSKILKVIIEAIQDKKGEHIITLDLRKINEAVSDFFIVCEASSNYSGQGHCRLGGGKCKKRMWGDSL
jgi:hypothetical protein